ncbi:hypothetical protein GCM10010149_45730 [Nonomuraea roseoviolacea subsp. roseoviolacea]|uniref:Uncharacterized protein n=1 Tax=Nonomuraea roseoviolacea subsp. carminata TaxID=160689 RepID=A0ABT1JZG6_9ACTN|nr:hypothetical protein [Nonomuraea roseoviolacea]MCP2347146.1 hypothetical protein [Nonomuraea roseoviolacea subsp. carminata]
MVTPIRPMLSPTALSGARALSPVTLMTTLLIASGGTMVALRIYAGVTAPEIDPAELRKAAAAFRRLADDLDGPERPARTDRAGGVAELADDAAASVWNNNGGESVDTFARLYIGRVMGFPSAFAKDCRVIAAGCDAYAGLVEAVRKQLAELDKAIVQLLWLVCFQPFTTALYGVAQAMAAAQMARLVRLAQVLKAVFGLNVGRVLQICLPGYVLTTLNYAAVDGAAYATGALGLDALSDAANGQPVRSPGENAEEFGEIVAGNTGYILGYDVAKLGLPGPATRGSEMVARLIGSGFGYTPVKSALDEDDDQVMTTPEEWASKIEGHGLRALIFPPGWKFGR